MVEDAEQRRMRPLRSSHGRISWHDVQIHKGVVVHLQVVCRVQQGKKVLTIPKGNPVLPMILNIECTLLSMPLTRSSGGQGGREPPPIPVAGMHEPQGYVHAFHAEGDEGEGGGGRPFSRPLSLCPAEGGEEKPSHEGATLDIRHVLINAAPLHSPREPLIVTLRLLRANFTLLSDSSLPPLIERSGISRQRDMEVPLKRNPKRSTS